MNNIEDFAIVVIYPDGVVECNKIANYNFHMQYLIELANNSERLLEIFKRNNIELSVEGEAASDITYSTDVKLAKEGIIVLRNMVLDDETIKGFYITVPSVINDIQKESFNKILEGFDMHDWWFGYLEDDKIIDVQYDDFAEMFGTLKK